MSKRPWGTEKDYKTRQEVAAEPEPHDELRYDEPVLVTASRPPGKKDTRSWCKGKVGRQHTLAIEVPPNNSSWRTCGWRTQHYLYGRPPVHYYTCAHAEMCTTCGKVFRTNVFWRDAGPLFNHECPLFTPREAAPPTD